VKWRGEKGGLTERGVSQKKKKKKKKNKKTKKKKTRIKGGCVTTISSADVGRQPRQSWSSRSAGVQRGGEQNSVKGGRRSKPIRIAQKSLKRSGRDLWRQKLKENSAHKSKQKREKG